MIRKKADIRVQQLDNPLQGHGHIELHHIFEPEDFYGKGRMFSHNFLDPGSETGYHSHHGEQEVFYFLNGQGIVNDNGTLIPIGPGDMAVCRSEEYHAVRNTGETALEYIALILFQE